MAVFAGPPLRADASVFHLSSDEPLAGVCVQWLHNTVTAESAQLPTGVVPMGIKHPDPSRDSMMSCLGHALNFTSGSRAVCKSSAQASSALCFVPWALTLPPSHLPSRGLGAGEGRRHWLHDGGGRR